MSDQYPRSKAWLEGFVYGALLGVLTTTLFTVWRLSA